MHWSPVGYTQYSLGGCFVQGSIVAFPNMSTQGATSDLQRLLLCAILSVQIQACTMRRLAPQLTCLAAGLGGFEFGVVCTSGGGGQQRLLLTVKGRIRIKVYWPGGLRQGI